MKKLDVKTQLSILLNNLEIFAEVELTLPLWRAKKYYEDRNIHTHIEECAKILNEVSDDEEGYIIIINWNNANSTVTAPIKAVTLRAITTVAETISWEGDETEVYPRFLQALMDYTD